LETSSGGDRTASGQPVPLPGSPNGGRTNLNLSFQFTLIVSCSPAVHHYEEPGSIFLLTSLWALGNCCWLPPMLSLLQVEEAQFLQHLNWQVIQPPNSLEALSDLTPVFLCLSCAGHQNWA